MVVMVGAASLPVVIVQLVHPGPHHGVQLLLLLLLQRRLHHLLLLVLKLLVLVCLLS